MYNIVPSNNENKESSFHCPVSGNGKAKLVLDRKSTNVIVRETSISGFTLEVTKTDLKRIKAAKKAILYFDDRKVQIRAESTSKIKGGNVLVVCSLIREFPPKEKIGLKSWLPSFGRAQRDDHDVSSHVAAYVGVVLLVFCIIAMPGIGDHLGTAPRIESAIKTFMMNMDRKYPGWRN